jgi:ubiquinone/menaquinone biosynthesis C-methylase UbiE
MAETFGRRCGAKLRKAGFVQGGILDVGSGHGATNLALVGMFPDSQFVGIDLSDPLLALAREAAQERGLSERVLFQKADVHEIPFEDNAFDVVLNANMVHLVDDPVRMLDEMERVLAPGGFLFVADLRRSFLGLLEREIRSALSVREARGLLQRAGVQGGVFSASLIWWRFERIPSRATAPDK